MRKRGKFRSGGTNKKGTRVGRGVYIYGRNPIREALRRSPQAVRRVLLSGEACNDKELKLDLARSGIPSEIVKARDIEKITGEEAVHQGAAAILDLSSVVISIEEFLRAIKPTSDTFLVLLDELTDPQNVGAIIRSAAAFNASGVLVPSRNQAPITGAVVKASAGMVFSVPIVSIGNVNQTVDTLKRFGFKTYALAQDGKVALRDEGFAEPAVFVVGNEGSGVRQKTMEHCDTTLRIPIDERCESLNASVAAAVVLYEWSSKRRRR
ncbi:MAG: 23S rRNA (guanosine(2251)-2'-O)-methyltransferase RlmB [Patescibacteria group bacterium]|nr:23S rRNA (guanosine(2251)-2'-O)-methyltransferase RlmB [Patescibacteria group bacterium]